MQRLTDEKLCFESFYGNIRLRTSNTINRPFIQSRYESRKWKRRKWNQTKHEVKPVQCAFRKNKHDRWKCVEERRKRRVDITGLPCGKVKILLFHLSLLRLFLYPRLPFSLRGSLSSSFTPGGRERWNVPEDKMTRRQSKDMKLAGTLQKLGESKAGKL